MTENNPEEVRNSIAPVLGRVPSGVFILVAGNDAGQQTGLLASWIQQASFEPPQVTVAVNKARFLNDWLRPGSPVTINQLRQSDPCLFRHFGKGFQPNADAFDGISSETGLCGLPRLSDAMATMEGEVTSQMEAGDHIIYLVTITSATAFQPPSTFEPFVHIRRNGFSY